MKDLESILRESAQTGASYVYIVPGACIRMRVDAHLEDVTAERLTPEQSETLLQGIYALTKGRPIELLRVHAARLAGGGAARGAL